ncbi:7008_t:CDS:2 [Dentiscutata erythropus]|uniref:7008_t:CDS:1 n=1 Tax=Dentiscutata erythropus TaxID=1348616 RepID=A0A9N9D3F9_9GLOM|nr:7008_t:CDS:2 [Dentiscutata erythropus]
MAINNETDEIDEFNIDTLADNNNINTEVNTSQAYTLDIMKDIDIGLQKFNLDQKANLDKVTTSSKRQAIILDQQNNDFNVRALARNMLMQSYNDM